MKLLSINVSLPKPIIIAGETQQTGIFKQPVTGAVQVGHLGLESDAQADQLNHGGEDQAVYLYSMEDYAWWSQELGRDLEPASFGENLTLDTFGASHVRVGDRFRIGEVLLEATGARIPCDKLASKMKDLSFAKRFKEAERPGVYARVLETGSICAGDSVERILTDGNNVTIVDTARVYYNPKADLDLLKRALASPIAVRSRAHFEKVWRKLEAAS